MARVNRHEAHPVDGAYRSNRDRAPLLAELGLRQVACEPVFPEPAVQELMSVTDNLYLFERALARLRAGCQFRRRHARIVRPPTRRSAVVGSGTGWPTGRDPIVNV